MWLKLRALLATFVRRWGAHSAIAITSGLVAAGGVAKLGSNLPNFLGEMRVGTGATPQVAGEALTDWAVDAGVLDGGCLVVWNPPGGALAPGESIDLTGTFRAALIDAGACGDSGACDAWWREEWHPAYRGGVLVSPTGLTAYTSDGLEVGAILLDAGASASIVGLDGGVVGVQMCCGNQVCGLEASGSYNRHPPPVTAPVTPAVLGTSPSVLATVYAGSTSLTYAITTTTGAATAASAASIGGIACTSVTVTSDHTLNCVLNVSGSHTAGPAAVAVTSPLAPSTCASTCASFAAAAVTSVSPTSGLTGGGTAATILLNAGATGATNAALNAISCASFSVTDDQHVSCTSAAASAGSGTASLTSPSSPTAGGSWTYTLGAVTGVSPTSSPTVVGSPLTITFTVTAGAATGTCTASLGANALTSCTPSGGNTVTCTLPVATYGAGTVNGNVTCNGITLTALAGGFAFTVVQAPILTALATPLFVPQTPNGGTPGIPIGCSQSCTNVTSATICGTAATVASTTSSSITLTPPAGNTTASTNCAVTATTSGGTDSASIPGTLTVSTVTGTSTVTVTTSVAHQLVTGQHVFITGVGGITGVNNTTSASAASGTFSVTNGSASVTSSVSNAILTGSLVSFSPQAGTYYTASSVSGTTITLTGNYTGTTNGAATATFETPVWTVTSTGASTFTLNGATGSGSYTSGGTVTGPNGVYVVPPEVLYGWVAGQGFNNSTGAWTDFVSGITASFTSGTHPTLNATWKAGQPGITFVGSGGLQGTFTALSQPGSMFAVADTQIASATMRIWDSNDATNRWDAAFTGNTLGNLSLYAGASTSFAGALSLASARLLNGDYANPNACAIFFDNTSVLSGSNCGTLTGHGISIGVQNAGSGPWNGTIAEVLQANSIPTSPHKAIIRQQESTLWSNL